ncbi:hypothetical protein [Orlajensenia leifsoniae]|uniref:Uncharacterized protein n=1 Tax=Orlajensenia leifsoniae TaxID=2561933 RepID=A0A4Y9R5G5_9MICO|nr:hypothetical protein [Leifsonia flava]TFV98776.1 hypothetical protein E4M00_04485 [Leifsonia flava]
MTASETKSLAHKDDTGRVEVKSPDRPSVTGKEAAPVLVKLPPPFFVRLSQIAWVMSLMAGGVAIGYLLIIRKAQLPAIADLVKSVDGSRADVTYATAADIVFWSVFTPLVVIVLAQIAMQVSFANRRPNVRWWQFGSVLFLGGVLLITRELVAFGERGQPLDRILLIQLGLAVLGLLLSLLPQALHWTAREHDIRRGEPVAPVTDGQL